MKPWRRARHSHPQYVTHSQLSHELAVVNKQIVSQAGQIDGLAERVGVLEEGFLVLAEKVAILEVMIS